MMRKVLTAAAMVMALIAPRAMGAQTGDQEASKNAAQARAALNAMIQALGGQAWLNIQNMERDGHVAAFFQGNPDLGTEQTFEFHQWPDRDRIEVTKHRDVVEFFIGRQGWEVTYRGKHALDKDMVDDFLRRRDHSIETAVKVWMKDSNTIMIYEGQRMSERHLAEQVTLISPQNEAITILLDVQTHLPLARSFQWRDPVYHDKNTDTEEYDDYHVVDGFPTPFTITRLKNGDTVRQYYVTRVKFNQSLPADFWDVDATARRIKK
jgi:type II secretory pathway pseudopilin PulG